MKHRNIINQLSLGQKAALMSGKNIWETQDIDGLLPAMFLADGPHGLRKQVGSGDHLGLNASELATCFPTAATLANSWDEELLEKVGMHIGQEAKASNVQVILGPGLNTKRNPKCGRNFEYYSEDPYLSGKMAAASIRGIQSTGTVASPKHFAVNSQENRRMASDSIVDERALREIYLTNFEIAIKEGKSKGIMSAYNLINGVYANENKELLQDILRDEWGFDGFVVSDWGGDNDHVEGVRNGSHLAMPGQSVNGPLEIIEAVRSGQLAETVLDERVDELIDVILNSTALSDEVPEIDWNKQLEVAREAAKRSVVLLKNEASVLPVNSSKKVSIIGEFAKTPRYQGAGSSVVNPIKIENTLEVVKDFPLNFIGYAKGYERGKAAQTKLEEEAIDLAKQSDVVLLYVGLDEIFESEGMDRTTLSMPENQQQLIEKIAQTSAKVVVILAAGSVIEMPWIDKVEGILHGYLSGSAGASAMMDVITGKYNPSGKLNETYPISYNDVLFGEQFPAEGRYAYYRESLYVGYRYYDSAKVAVQFPFGYGLSYTTFDYSLIETTRESIKLKVINSGMIDGEEIVQLYVGKSDSRLMRPVKELKGFKKVFLKAGESQTITIPFDDKTFRYFDTEKHEWEIEAGTYQLYIGSNSRDIRLQDQLDVNGVIPAIQSNDHYLNRHFQKLNTEDFEQLYGKPLPKEKQAEKYSLNRNHTISDMKHAKNLLARLVYKVIDKLLIRSQKKGTPDLNLLFIYNMPFRAIAKMTNGMVDMKMVDSMLIMVNGQTIKGCSKLISNFIANRKVQKTATLTQEE
ncbi:glycoside hydrolase family 3 C-terminal domain-containing protein [Marinilactibacillus psychrotolerans]|uniref:glycoside hydrolase family 3 C-terminal domain-containing protein n=1 Tax=Marinilactibacillus psychrotolerans TaxID=191770 RepID=UPI0039AF58D0